jgi:hypothetical protein
MLVTHHLRLVWAHQQLQDHPNPHPDVDADVDVSVGPMKNLDELMQYLNYISCNILTVSGIHPGYSCKEGGRVEDGLLLEFPCTPTRTRSV